jgi:hypothetical protein
VLCKQGVTVSIPVTSTNFFSDCTALVRFMSAPISRFWFLLCTNCARMAYWTATVHIGAATKTSAAAGAISLARRFSFSKASRFIYNFIWEYFLKTCASPWRSIWVTHSSATPPALSLAAYVERRS